MLEETEFRKGYRVPVERSHVAGKKTELASIGGASACTKNR